MSKNVELVYKTISAKAIVFYQKMKAGKEFEALRRKQYMESLAAAYGPGSSDTETRLVYVGSNWNGSDYVSGMEATPSERYNPPTGWRYDKNKGFLVPALRSTEGKNIQAELAALSGQPWLNLRNQEIGIPEMVLGSEEDSTGIIYRYSAGLVFDEDTNVLYQTWGTGKVAAEVEASWEKHPEIVWEEVKRSEWYAREEALEAARKAEE